VGSEPAAFHHCGNNVWAHRTGLVLLDGMIVAEIIGTLFALNGTYVPVYPAFDDPHNYLAFPHPVTALVSVSWTGAGPSGYGWGCEYDAYGALTKVPIAFLAGPIITTETANAYLQVCRLNVPANFEAAPISFEKYYGGVGLIRVADPSRLYQARNVDISTGCEGNYSVLTDTSGTYLTWGTSTATKTLRQYNAGYTLHEWIAAVMDGNQGNNSYEVRNRSVSILRVLSGWPPETPPPPYVPDPYKRLWQPDPLGSFMHPSHPLGV